MWTAPPPEGSVADACGGCAGAAEPAAVEVAAASAARSLESNSFEYTGFTPTAVAMVRCGMALLHGNVGLTCAQTPLSSQTMRSTTRSILLPSKRDVSTNQPGSTTPPKYFVVTWKVSLAFFPTNAAADGVMTEMAQ